LEFSLGGEGLFKVRGANRRVLSFRVLSLFVGLWLEDVGEHLLPAVCRVGSVARIIATQRSGARMCGGGSRVDAQCLGALLRHVIVGVRMPTSLHRPRHCLRLEVCVCKLTPFPAN
jgi:hypothetical protein